jgi:flagellar basal body-associated protein FliL
MKSKLKIILPLALLMLGGGMYKLVLAKPALEPKPKVDGAVYVLGKDFLVNLDDGHFAKLGVAVVVDPTSAAPAEGGGEHEAAPKPPEGYGPMPQEAVVRDIVTDTLTDVDGADLTSRHGREALKDRIERRILASTDVKVHDVLFTDVSVQ